MRVIVCGGRDYEDNINLEHVMDTVWELWSEKADDGFFLATGECSTGADHLAKAWGEVSRCVNKYTGYPAKWKLYGGQAGPIRNAQMLEEFKPDLVVAFPGGKGTADMVAKAKAAGVTVILVGNSFPL